MRNTITVALLWGLLTPASALQAQQRQSGLSIADTSDPRYLTAMGVLPLRPPA